MRLRFALLLAWLCAALLGGCASTQPEPKWVGGDLRAESERLIWAATRTGLSKNNFPIGAGIDEAHLIAVSGWRQSLAPFRGKGYRERCHIKWTNVAEQRWHLEVRVERQRNDDISHPLDPSYAEWVPDPDNEERARLVAQFIRSMLATQ
jgi:hypothetical protein